MSWILDGVGRKRPVAPWNTGHAYPAQWEDGLDPEDRPETTFEKAKKWCEFSLDDLGLSLPEDAQSDRLRLGIILPADRPARENRITWSLAVSDRHCREDPLGRRGDAEHTGTAPVERVDTPPDPGD